jgi:hypothetical protein
MHLSYLIYKKYVSIAYQKKQGKNSKCIGNRENSRFIGQVYVSNVTSMKRRPQVALQEAKIGAPALLFFDKKIRGRTACGG